MKFALIVIFSLLLKLSLAVETRGMLKPLEGQAIVVGESYPFKLTLLPFEKRLIKKEDLEGKQLFNLFYVVEIKSVGVSENNYDAVEVILDLVLLKKAELRDVYIWNLKDRNIPVDVEKLTINDVKLNIRDFIVLNTPSVPFEKLNPIAIGLSLLVLVLLGAVLLLLRKNRAKKKPNLTDYSKYLKNVESHEDLEKIFRYRREILSCANDPVIKDQIEGLISTYETKQYAPDWKDVDLEMYKEKFKELGRNLTSGV